MRKIELADYKLATIKIHVLGAEFYRTAYEQKNSSDSLAEYLKVQAAANKQILELVNGKPTS